MPGFLKLIAPAVVFVTAVTIATLSAASLAATTINGTVTLEGSPAAGAQVTVRHLDSNIAITAFTGTNGGYNLRLDSTGHHAIRASWSTYISDTRQLVTNGEASQHSDIALRSDPDYLDRITSEQWLSLLPEGGMKREFILNCASCHEIESDRILVDGKPRSLEQWAAAFAMMRAIDQYNILPLDFDDAKYTAWLSEHLDEDAAASLTPAVPADPEQLTTVRITEYPLPEATELPHDLVVGPKGRIWITAFFNDVMWALDPASGAIDTYKVRPEGADGWGQARALVFDTAGTLWIVLGGTHELVALDPQTRQFKTHNIGMYAHSLVIDGRGRVWFNDYFAEKERIGMLDPASGNVEHIELPSAGLTKEQGLPLPYGLQIDSAGRLYSTQMAANTIVRYDTTNGNASMIMMPVDNSAPRRPAIGANDTLWVPEWNTGYLSGYDPHSGAFKRYKVGSSALGAYDAEYDNRSGHVWVTGALGSSMVLFDPADGTSLEIPLPTNPGYTRHLAVDPQTGDLWSAYSSLPAAQPKVVRIER